jgi:serine/threonine protein kinase
MYILLCGKPPFYPNSGSKLTEGMKFRIRAGEYSFPDEDWKNVSNEAKNLIKRLLVPNSEDRMNIDEVMSHVWITKHVDIPQTQLSTTSILQEDLVKIPEMNNAISGALLEKRVNYDEGINLKSIDEANNNLLKKRLLKK